MARLTVNQAAPYAIDFEFLDNGQDSTIDFISVGIVDIQNPSNTLYLITDTLTRRMWDAEWLPDNVIAPILREHGVSYPCSFDKARRTFTAHGMSNKDVTTAITKYFGGKKFNLYGWYSNYDYVLLCLLYGGMLSTPDGFPMFIHDIRALVALIGNKSLKALGDGNHNALDDAKQIAEAHGELMGILKTYTND